MALQQEGNCNNSNSFTNKKEQTKCDKNSDNMLAMLVHEVKTPIHSINLMLELLKESKQQSADQKEYISILSKCMEQLNDTISIFVTYTKLGNSMITKHDKPFNLYNVIEECLHILHPISMQKTLQIKYEYATDLEQEFIGDSKHIKQIIINLLSNSIKFTEKGDIIICVNKNDDHSSSSSSSNNNTNVTSNKQSIRITISDTGIGIPESEMDRIFEPFTQLDCSLSRKNDGLGLGLPIVKRLVKLLNGQIDVESTVHGSVFTIIIPLEYNDLLLFSPIVSTTSVNNEESNLLRQKRLRLRRSPNSSSGQVVLSNCNNTYSTLNILIVDDNEYNRISLSTILLSIGIKTTSLSSGKEALIYLQNSVHFDLAFIDIKMPEMDGIELARRIHVIDKDTTLVALSSISKEDIRQKSIMTDFFKWLIKPIKKDQILRIIYQYKQLSVSTPLLSNTNTNTDTGTNMTIKPKATSMSNTSISYNRNTNKKQQLYRKASSSMPGTFTTSEATYVRAMPSYVYILLVNVGENEKGLIQKFCIKSPKTCRITTIQYDITNDGELSQQCIKMKTLGYMFDIILIDSSSNSNTNKYMENFEFAISVLKTLSPRSSIICVLDKKCCQKKYRNKLVSAGISSFMMKPLDKMQLYATFLYHLKKVKK